jgi:hypothetical protein
MNTLGQDEVFSQLDNLPVDHDNPWDQTTFPDHLNEKLMHGGFARMYLESNKLVPGCDLLVPVILYLDEINVTWNGRVNIQPVMMAVGLLNSYPCYSDENIQCLGYIPGHDTRSTSTKNHERQKDSHRSTRNFH